MSVNLSFIIKDLASENRARLGLCFEADGAAPDSLDIAAAFRITLPESSGKDLYALLVCIGFHDQRITNKRGGQR